MCGINGFITKTSSSYNREERISRMNQALSHRGPDDNGTFVTNIDSSFVLALGQARLSIIDLSEAGHQPMFYKKGIGASNIHFHPQDDYDLSIVFNGEIYNYAELKAELEGMGYVFSTHSDTEIILAGYLAWGTQVVNRFNGMWAFCLFDRIKKSFFCSRDRFGKKPFYYVHNESNFIFSSEIKGILEHTELSIRTEENIDHEALDFYFTTGYIPAPLTLYKNIRKLEAGHNLLVQIEASRIHIHPEKYYEIPPFAPEENRELLIQDGKTLLADAVQIRMFSADVPVGAFLSGGLDSSSVVAEMTKYTEKSKLHTFSVGFSGRYDETPYIEIVKNAFGTNHHHAYFERQDFENMLENISYFYDEPFGDYSHFPTTFVSELARRDVTVALSGDGGDEVFGGYTMHKVAAAMTYLYRLPLFIRRLGARLIPSTKNNLSFLSRLREAFRVSTFPQTDFFAELGSSSLYKPEVYKNWTREKLSYLLEKNHGNFIQSIIDFDLLYNTLADNFLTKVDRASMSQSLEVRSPFLDYRFIEFSRRIPTKWKVTPTTSKILMRDIIRDIVPDAIVNRSKQGFEPPVADWILEDSYRIYITTGLELLNERGYMSDAWYKFYKNSVLQNSNKLYSIYMIRLFLLIKWREKWMP